MLEASKLLLEVLPWVGICTQTHFSPLYCCRDLREVGGVELAEALGLGWRVHFSLGAASCRLGAVVLPQKEAAEFSGGGGVSLITALVWNC